MKSCLAVLVAVSLATQLPTAASAQQIAPPLGAEEGAIMPALPEETVIDVAEPGVTGDGGYVEYYSETCSQECCDPDCDSYLYLNRFFNNCPWACSSDAGFDDFISPITNPFWFEDPRTLTEIRPTVLHQALPGNVSNGHFNVLAMPIRVALSDRTSLIIPKNGFLTTDSNFDDINDGWLDTSIGFKYNVMKDYCQRRILTTGFSYEMPSGDADAFQGNGDGVFNLFASYGAGFGDIHWISGSGFVLPANSTDESQIWWWSNHVDRKVMQRDCLSVYALGEVNWYHWGDSGQDGFLFGIEGNDLFNFGSPAVAGNDIVTGAFGTKIKPYGNAMEIGVAWETHLTTRRDLLEDRLTIDWILRF
jgi:hypothetical protein